MLEISTYNITSYTNSFAKKIRLKSSWFIRKGTSMQKKVQQHYVWEHYLTSWNYNGSHMFCYRNDKKNIFPINPEKIAKEREFYKLKNINANEIAFLEKTFISPLRNFELRNMNRSRIDIFTYIFKFKEEMHSKGIKDEKLNTEIDVIINNLEEDLHTKIEEKAIPILASLTDGKLSIKDNKDEATDYNEAMGDFILFLTTQYFRTKKLKMNYFKVLQTLPEIKNMNPENIWNVLSHILASNLGNTLYATRNEYKWSILTTDSNASFITGDQPVINTFGNYSAANSLDNSVDEENFELYYPLTPSKALLVSQTQYINKSDIVNVDPEEVNRYNKLIFNACEEQVFSNNKMVLEDLCGPLN